MQELRVDELSGHWVLLAPARAARPHTFRAATSDPRPRGECPFCPGNEGLTPPEVARTGAGSPDTPDWRVRVVPNLYPIVGGGAHEVVVLSPDHERSFAQLPEAAAVEVLTVMRDRVRYHLAAGRAYAVTVINHGREAGASIEHPHAQVVALDMVPPALDAAVARFAAAGTDLVLRDAERGRLLLDEPAAAWCPHAASAPYEIRVAHPTANGRFDEASERQIADVACATRDVLTCLAAVAGDVPYNLVVHSAPPRHEGPFHWYVEVQPRITVVAGFEMATGMHVNILPPEQAADELRMARRS